MQKTIKTLFIILTTCCLAGDASADWSKRPTQQQLLAGYASDHWLVIAANKEFLHHAEQGDLGAVERYLSLIGANIEGQTKDGETALFLAVKNGHLHVAKFLLNKGANPNVLYVRPIQTLLLWSIIGNEKEIFDFLLEDARMNPNITFDGDITPLMTAARYDREEMANKLLVKGASLDARSTSGETALSRASRYNAPQVIRLLMDEWGTHPDPSHSCRKTVQNLADST